MLVVTSVILTDKEPIKTGYMTNEILQFTMYLLGCSEEEALKKYSDWQEGVRTTRIPELHEVLTAICKENNINIADVKGKCRIKDLVETRKEYCYMAKDLTHKSFRIIGEEINRDHATVLHHYNEVKFWLKIPGYHLKEKLERIEEELKL